MGNNVFSYLASFIKHIITWFDESFSGKCYNKFCAWCYKVYQESCLSRFFDTKNDGAAGKSSFFGKLVRIPENILLFLRKKLSAPINRVIEKSAFCSFVSRWEDLSIRFYGIVLLVFSVLTYAFCELGKIELLALGLLLVVSLLCILINRSLRGIFGGSLIFKSIVNLFYETKEGECDFYPCGVKQTVVAAVSGAILSFFAMSFGFGIALLLLAFFCRRSIFNKILTPWRIFNGGFLADASHNGTCGAKFYVCGDILYPRFARRGIYIFKIFRKYCGMVFYNRAYMGMHKFI